MHIFSGRFVRRMACMLVLMLLPCACAQEAQMQPKPRLSTILLAGVDHLVEGEADPLSFRNGGQADFLLLLVLDKDAETITPIHIDRDTITEITTLSVLGKVSGSRQAQICLAHSFGDGREYSAQLLCDAVGGLMGGASIDYYITMGMEGVAAANDALGGVEVTLGEADDFSRYDPAMKPGETITLQGRQATIYTTRRFYVGDETNAARQLRQRNYMNAAKETLLQRLGQDPLFIIELIEKVDDYICTNMSAMTMLSFVDAVFYEIQPIRTVDGIHRSGSNGFMEFIPDEQSLQQLIMDVFYEPAA